MRALAVDLAPRRICSSAIVHGVVRTPLSETAAYARSAEALQALQALQAVAAEHPLGPGAPADGAQAAGFLLSDRIASPPLSC